MKITKVGGNSYKIEEMTGGKLYALWCVLETKRQETGLTPVENDCWIQLNRFVGTDSPNLINVSV